MKKKRQQRLTTSQLEYLVDKIVQPDDGHESAEALIVLMDEVEQVALSCPLDIENITVPVKDHSYYRFKNTENQQQELISEVRGKLAATILT